MKERDTEGNCETHKELDQVTFQEFYVKRLSYKNNWQGFLPLPGLNCKSGLPSVLTYFEEFGINAACKTGKGKKRKTGDRGRREPFNRVS